MTDDLTANRPGEGASAKAAELSEGTPVALRALDRLAGLRTEDRAWAEGAKGERRVAKALARLEKRGWLILHDVTVGTRGANVDHVAIGPPGVFVIDAKYTRKKVVVRDGTIRFGGYRRHGYITGMARQRDLSVQRLSAAVGFPVPVQPVLCLVTPVTADSAKFVDRIEGLWFCHAEGLVRLLRKNPRHPDLSDRQIETIKQAARRPDVWLPTLASPEPELDDAESAEADDIALVRWTKFGHDRVYATSPDGDKLGWIDMATGQHHDVPEDREDVADSLTAIRNQLLADAAPGATEPHGADESNPAQPVGESAIAAVTINRWRRYGNDRLYANGPDGEKWGYLDLATGDLHLEPGAPADLGAQLRAARP